MDYQRLVSYIYSYPEGVKGRNVGFAKALVHQGQFKLSISLRGVRTDSPEMFGIYMMVNDSGYRLIKLGESLMKMGQMEYSGVFNPDNISDTGYGFPDICGLAVAREDARYDCMLSMWRDEDVTPDMLVFSGMDAKKHAEAEIVIKERMRRSDEEERKKELAGDGVVKSEGFKYNAEASEAVRSGATGVKAVRQEVVRSGAAGAKAARQEAVRSGATGAKAARQEAVRSGEAGAKAVRQEAARSGAAGAKEVSPEAARLEATGTGAVRQKAANLEAAGVGVDRRQETEVADRSLETTAAGGTTPAEDIKASGAAARKPENTQHLQTKAGRAAATQPNPFEKLFVRADYVDVFEDDYFYDCIEISPEKLKNLNLNEPDIAGNSFLLHGYYNFRHILFGRVRDNLDNTQYFIGVPGMYCNRERYMASMFGFNNFKKSHRSDYANPYFGYWYQEI